MRLPIFRFRPPHAAFVGVCTVIVIMLTAGITYAATGGLKPDPKPTVQSSTHTSTTETDNGAQKTLTRTVVTHTSTSTNTPPSPTGNTGSTSSSSQSESTSTTTQSTTNSTTPTGSSTGNNSGTNGSGSTPPPTLPPLTALTLHQTSAQDPTAYWVAQTGSMPNSAQYAFFWSNSNTCATTNASQLEACGTKVVSGSGSLQIPPSSYSPSNPVSVVVCEYINGQCSVTSNLVYVQAGI